MESHEHKSVTGLPLIQYMFACETFSQDPTGRASYINQIEILNAPQFPATTPNFTIVFGLWNVLPGTYRTKIKVFLENSQEALIEQQLQDIAMPSQQNTVRIILGIQNITWPAPGRYFVQLIIRDEPVGTFSVIAQQVPLTPGLQMR